MRIITMERDRTIPGWRAEFEADSSGRPLRCHAYQPDGAVNWTLTRIDTQIITRGTIRTDTAAHDFLEAAKADAEEGEQAGVGARERRQLLG